MRESETNTSSLRITRYRTLIAALAFILVGGAAFAAVGGVEAVKKVFVNVTIRLMGPDGESYEYVQLQPFEIEDGTASTTLEIGDGQMATMVLEKTGGSDSAESADIVEGEFTTAMATITIGSVSAPQGDIGAERTIELSMTANTGDEAIDQEFVLEQIANADVVVPWVDSAGEIREFYVVRSFTETEPVLKVFSSRLLDSGEEVYDMVGLLTGVITDGDEITAVDIDDEGLATMTLLLENGEEKRVAFNVEPNDPGVVSDAIDITVITIDQGDE